jgi:hypothetical protein
MNVRQVIVGVAVAIVLLGQGAGGAAAADAKQRFSARGLGTTTCGKYLEARNLNAKDSLVYADWMMGFITAYNWLKSDTYDVAPQYKSANLLKFLDLYCGKNPKTMVVDAAKAFVDAVYAKRLKSGS